MDADENGVGVLLRNLKACRQVEHLFSAVVINVAVVQQDVFGAGHDDREAGGGEQDLQLFGDAQIQIFFQNTGHAGGAAVLAAVSGVKDDRGQRGEIFCVAAFSFRRGAGSRYRHGAVGKQGTAPEGDGKKQAERQKAEYAGGPGGFRTAHENTSPPFSYVYESAPECMTENNGKPPKDGFSRPDFFAKATD